MEPEKTMRPAKSFRSTLRLGLISGLFALSGCASLMDQVVWLRYLGLTFGNTTLAAATLLAVFMGGLGMGAPLFGRLADRLRRPLVVYAVVQIGVALFAVASPIFFRWMDQAYIEIYRSVGSQPALFPVVRALLAAVFLLPPTLLMGGTLPLVLRAVTAEGDGAGRRTALLYACNTLGAVAGVALAGFWTIRLVGLNATLLLAASLDLLAGLGCLLLSRTLPSRTPAAPAPTPAPSESPSRDAPRIGIPLSRRGRLLTLFFLMGATSLALEVLWTRVLVFYLGSSVYSYSLMLVLFLLGVGLGSLLVAPWADRFASPLKALAAVEILLAVWGVVQVGLFLRLNAFLLRSAEFLRPQNFLETAWIRLAGGELLPGGGVRLGRRHGIVFLGFYTGAGIIYSIVRNCLASVRLPPLGLDGPGG